MIGPTLFGARAVSKDGEVVTFHMTAAPVGLVFAVTLPDGTNWGVVLDRHEAQRARHAITAWLVDAAPTVTS